MDPLDRLLGHDHRATARPGAEPKPAGRYAPPAATAGAA
jgi:hypothetical protein